MTAKVSQSPFGAWTWEIFDDDGVMYLRSDRCFVNAALAFYDLESSTYLIRPHIQYQ